jgi:hypothetical protein
LRRSKAAHDVASSMKTPSAAIKRTVAMSVNLDELPSVCEPETRIPWPGMSNKFDACFLQEEQLALREPFRDNNDPPTEGSPRRSTFPVAVVPRPTPGDVPARGNNDRSS